MTPADLIEQLMVLTDVDEFLGYLHPDAEYQPLPDSPVYRGLTEIRAWAEHEAADPARAQPLPVSVTETVDKAVVRGQVRFVRGTVERRHSVLEVAAWVVTVSDGKLRRVEAFSSWTRRTPPRASLRAAARGGAGSAAASNCCSVSRRAAWRCARGRQPTAR